MNKKTYLQMVDEREAFEKAKIESITRCNFRKTEHFFDSCATCLYMKGVPKNKPKVVVCTLDQILPLYVKSIIRFVCDRYVHNPKRYK